MNSVYLFVVVLSALLQLILASSSYYTYNGGEYVNGNGYPSATVNGNGYPGAVVVGNGYPSAAVNGNGYPSAAVNGNGYPRSTNGGVNGNNHISSPMNGKEAQYAAPAPYAYPPPPNYPPPNAAFSLGSPYGLQSYYYNPYATIYNTAKSYHREDVHQSETKVVPNPPRPGYKN